MKTHQTKSGLLVVTTPPSKPPSRIYEQLEIQDEEQRYAVTDALIGLWDAMELTLSTRFCGLSGEARKEAHLLLYRTLAKMLLGKDYPEGEQET